MSSSSSPSLPRPGGWVGSWALWQLPRRATAFVLAVDLLALVALLLAALSARWQPSDLGVFLVLVGCALGSVEGSRHLGSPATRRDRPYKDMLSAWMLPAAMLLPPVYAMLIPVPVYLLVQLRVTRILPVKRLFNTASVALAGLGASLAHHALAGSWGSGDLEQLTSLRQLAAAGAAAVVFSAGSAVLVAVVLCLAVPSTSRRTAFAGWPMQATEAAELCLGVAVALLCAARPVLAVLVLPPMLLLQRTLLHAELLHAARTDAKTGLADPRHWRDVAERELLRARSGGQDLSVLLVDIDRFKAVNDRHGHLVGDRVLADVADQLRAAVRPRDLVGRFGGEEFVVLLTDATPAAAAATAERICARIRQRTHPLPDDEPPLCVTVSIGAAALGLAGHDLAELLEAADAACFAAKTAGRDRVRLAPPSAGATRLGPAAQPWDAGPAVLAERAGGQASQ